MADPGDRARGALLGALVGDALGMPWETMPASLIPERVYMRAGRLPRGSYTDDGQMTIVLAESLHERGAVDPVHLGAAFAAAFEPERGYGQGTTRVLEQVRAGEPPLEVARRLFGGEGSAGNGAAMRVAPLAILFAHDPERLLDQAEASALVTHAHPHGVDGARVQAAAVAAALRGDHVLEAARAAARTPEFRERLEGASRGNGTLALDSVPAALHCAAGANSFEAAVSAAVRLGGDTDTIASMAGAVAGARDGASAIPAEWLDALEDGERGRSHAELLADRLHAAQCRP